MLNPFTFLVEIELEFYIPALPERLRFQVHNLCLQTTEALAQSNQSKNCNAFDALVSLRWRHSLNKISPRRSQLVFSEIPDKSQRRIF